MNLQTVITNLKRTIAGKEAYLEEVRQARLRGTDREDVALFATQEMLKINIDELNRILDDLEQCQDDEYLKKAIEQSWRDNPDRSGGQFTDEEIARSSEWR